MRTLLLTRGAPGAGKTTWIKNNHLEDYTISPDNIRTLCSSPELQPSGEFKISQERNNENAVWEVLFKILEHRMSRGEFTVVDATASKTKDIQQYKDLADQYRYRLFIVDFTDVTLETCLAQNKMRPLIKQVPDKAIENIYARFATQKVPAGVKVIKRDEFNTLLEQPIDLSEYKKIVFIGDIHGCYDTLMQYPDFKEGLKEDTEYIFLGDYCDRGNQNFEVLQFLDKIKDLPNVCLLEGNHEIHIRDFGNNAPSKSKEFEEHTKPELYAKGYTEKQARMLYRKLRQFSHFTYNGLEILACHAGIPNLNTNLLFLPTYKFIHGVGEYADYLTVTESWMGQTKNNQYLVHGHRNTEASETQIADRVFNLEGRVEFGGKLRIVELTGNFKQVAWCHTEELDTGKEYDEYETVFEPNWNVVELDDCQPITEELHTEERPVETVEEAVAYLRNNKFVQEKKLGNDISSFNFTRDAFYKGNWNRQTILARGLFIDTVENKIMARSYEKFFRINEVIETELAALKNRFVFPVTAYVKENGFLAIVSYDYKNDDLFIASKSTNKGDYVEYIKTQLDPYKDKLLERLKEYYKLGVPKSYVFECEDIEHDPHIIKYEKNNIVLLDCINNKLDYISLPYETLKYEAELIGCPVKEKAFELKDWDAFKSLYNEVQDEEYKYKGNYIEGFVFVDQNGFMTKCKTAYYNLWKKLRGVADSTLRCGYITKTGMLTSSTENLFYGYCKELYNKDYSRETKSYPYKTDIISLREKFLNR